MPAPSHTEPAAPAGAGRWLLLSGLFLATVAGAWSGAQAVFIGAGLAACAVHWTLWPRVRGARSVLAGAFALRAAAFPLPPSLSDDTYRYVWDGLLTRAGLNPYLHRPVDAALEAFQALPLFELLNSPTYFTVYPPFSQLVFWLGTWLGGGTWTGSYYATKAVFVVLEGAGLLVLARLVAPARLALYALHPLAALETAGQGHTEAALVLALVLAVAAVRGGRGAAAGGAVGFAGCVKLFPFVLVPFLVRRWGVRAVAAAAGVTAVLALPFADPAAPLNAASSLSLYVRVFEFNPGPYLVLRELLAAVLGYNPIRFLGPLLGAAFFAAAAWHLRRTWRAPESWPFERTVVWVFGAYLLCATTVHPWYLLGVLCILPLCPRPGAHWWWLAALTFPTYLRYGPGALADAGYYAAVVVGWGGFAVIALRGGYGARLLGAVLERRGRAKADRVAPFLPARRGGPRVLDLGAGEGWVAHHLAEHHGAEVTLADVVEPPGEAAGGSAPPRQYVRYDGRRLPFSDDAFDAVVLYFVLHHAADARAVVREALRVAPRVIVAESVYTTSGEHRRLAFLDRLANRLRLDGQLRAQEAHLRFRTVAAWRALFEAEGAAVRHESARGRWLHRQHLFVLDRAGAPLQPPPNT